MDQTVPLEKRMKISNYKKRNKFLKNNTTDLESDALPLRHGVRHRQLVVVKSIKGSSTFELKESEKY